MRIFLLHCFLNFFFDLLYHPLAWCYNYVAYVVSLGRWKSWVTSLASIAEGPIILELGHGPGHLLAALQARGFQVIGLDESRQMGALALRRLKKRDGRLLPALFARGYAQALPFKSNAFSSVVATFPTEYIGHPDTLYETFRVLKPGGYFLVLITAWITGTSLFERFAAWLFLVTGQTQSLPNHFEPLLNQINRAGFSSRQIWVDLPGSRLLILEARKPGQVS